MNRRDQYAEYRARVAALLSSGTPKEAAHSIAMAEHNARKAARKAELAALKVTRDKAAMTCQICARPILAESGQIAHHGYMRPGDGYQTNSCWGARQLPYEADRERLRQYLVSVLESFETAKKRREDLESESVPCRFTWEKYDRALGRSVTAGHVDATRDSFAGVKAAHASKFMQARVYSFEDLKAENVSAAARREKFYADEYKAQKARFDAWRITHKFNGATWELIK